MSTSFQTIMPHGITAGARAPVRGAAAPVAAISGTIDQAKDSRRRFKAGRAEFTYRNHARQCPVSVTPTERTVHVVVPLAGHAVIVGKGEVFTLGVGQALLLGGSDRTVCVWAADARSLLLTIPRASIQAEASVQLARPRRLAMVDCPFAWSAEAFRTPGPPAFDDPLHRTSDLRIEKRMLADLVAALGASGDKDMLFPVARSVERAVEHMRGDPTRDWSAEELAPVGGVTPATLRRNFKTCLGVTITQSAQQLRLEWVRMRLQSETESRSIRDLSVVAGFGASGMLNRAYQRRFGETPTQTRARIFRS